MSKRNKNNNKKKTKNTLERQQETFNDEGKGENANEEEQFKEQPQTENPPEIANQNLVEEQAIEVHQQKVEDNQLEGGCVEDGQLQNQEGATNEQSEQPAHEKEQLGVVHEGEKTEVNKVQHEEVVKEYGQENQEQQKVEEAPILKESENIPQQEEQPEQANHGAKLGEHTESEKVHIITEELAEKQDPVEQVADHYSSAEIQHQIREHLNEIVDQIEQHYIPKEQQQNNDAALIEEALIEQPQVPIVYDNVPLIEHKVKDATAVIEEPLKQDLQVMVKHETDHKDQVHIEQQTEVQNSAHEKVQKLEQNNKLDDKNEIQEEQQERYIIQEEITEEIVQFKQKVELIELESTPTNIEEVEVKTRIQSDNTHEHQDGNHTANKVEETPTKPDQQVKQKLDVVSPTYEIKQEQFQDLEKTQPSVTVTKQADVRQEIEQKIELYNEQEYKPPQIPLRTQQLEVSQIEVQSQQQDQQPNVDDQAPKITKSGYGVVNMMSAAVVGALIIGTIGGIVLNRVLRRI